MERQTRLSPEEPGHVCGCQLQPICIFADHRFTLGQIVQQQVFGGPQTTHVATLLNDGEAAKLEVEQMFWEFNLF